MSAELKRDYEIGEEIGRGRFGVVHRCTSRATGEAFAVKSVDRSQLADDLDRELVQQEPKLAQLAGAGNPGVVQVHAVYEDEAWTHTVMDLCTGPDLLDWVSLRRGAPVPEPLAAAIVAQIAQALALCHRHGDAGQRAFPAQAVRRRVPGGQGPDEAHDLPRRVEEVHRRASPRSPLDRDRRLSPGNGAANLKRHTRRPWRTVVYRNTDVVYTVLYVRTLERLGESL